MCPSDRTPHGEEILHTLPQPQFPQPTPAVPGRPVAAPRSSGAVTDRPPIPDASELQGVDVEDEEADPVVESGPGVDVPPTDR